MLAATFCQSVSNSLLIIGNFLFSDNRTYHFQAEDEADQRAWMSVLVNCKEGALHRAFDDSGKSGGSKINPSLLELQQTIIRYVQKLPGNDRCCDCNSQNGKNLLNFLKYIPICCHLLNLQCLPL